MSLLEREHWRGLVGYRVPQVGVPSIAAIVEVGSSWSSPVRVIGVDRSERAQYFVKFQEACPTDDRQSVVIEFVVAEIGRVIGAPVCATTLIAVPPALRGVRLHPNWVVDSDYAHASRAIDHCDERGRPQLDARARDDNRRRQVGIYALYDLFFGFDQQWLYDIDDDRAIYSHDHGLYLPPVGTGSWTESELIALVDEAHQLPDSPVGLDSAAIASTSAALRRLDRAALLAILRRVPTGWGVDDADLEALGWFLERRAPAVADRIEGLAIGAGR